MEIIYATLERKLRHNCQNRNKLDCLEDEILEARRQLSLTASEAWLLLDLCRSYQEHAADIEMV